MKLITIKSFFTVIILFATAANADADYLTENISCRLTIGNFGSTIIKNPKAKPTQSVELTKQNLDDVTVYSGSLTGFVAKVRFDADALTEVLIRDENKKLIISQRGMSLVDKNNGFNINTSIPEYQLFSLNCNYRQK